MKAEALLRRLLAEIEDGFNVRVDAIYAEDAEVTRPFSTGEDRVLMGAEAIARTFAGASAAGLRVSVRNLRIHHTSDPHVVIGEFDYEWHRPGKGNPTSSNVQVIEERDGLIVRSRDYHDTGAIGRIMRADDR